MKSNAFELNSIPPQFIKILLPYIIDYLTHIFNTIIKRSEYPSVWKQVKIIPIPKANNEYRPISILPFLSKVFDRIIHTQLSQYLNDHNLLSKRQSGFKPEHSCITALIDVSKEIRSSIDAGLVASLMLLYHSKA